MASLAGVRTHTALMIILIIAPCVCLSLFAAHLVASPALWDCTLVVCVCVCQVVVLACVVATESTAHGGTNTTVFGWWTGGGGEGAAIYRNAKARKEVINARLPTSKKTTNTDTTTIATLSDHTRWQ